MDKNEAKKLADKYSDKSEVVLITSDGSVFFGQHRHACNYHAREKGLEVFEFVNGKNVEFVAEKMATIPKVVITDEPVKAEKSIAEEATSEEPIKKSKKSKK